MKYRTKVDIALLTVSLLIGIIAITNAQNIGDWWHLRNYEPGDRIITLADESGMNQTGKKLFYRFNPELVTEEEMTEKCDIVRLGCIEGNSIYILEPRQPADRYGAVVTAAHEMLHVAYDRIPESERITLHQLIDKEIKQAGHIELITKLKTYPAEDYYNEAHSFLGSEIPDLSPELETHYKSYFTDRQKTIKAYKKSPEYY